MSKFDVLIKFLYECIKIGLYYLNMKSQVFFVQKIFNLKMFRSVIMEQR